MSTENPYQTPAATEVVAPPALQVREVREEHMKHEASLKAVGFLGLLGGVLLLGSFAFVGIEAIAAGLLESSSSMSLLFEVAFGTLQIIAGIGLRQLQGWARIPAAIVAAVSMTSVPIGTIVGLYILYLLFSPKGSKVLSAEYREIVAVTPDMRYRTPRWFWIFILVAVLVLVGFVVFVFFAARAR
ncbi:hypothetical protein [Luteolibacter soli]|uniref:Uncharacterized protein n=1 Tax=Luteolibacter soli TaxID=3135280 RepID=A0ABU9AZM7_9BACT